MTPALFHLAPGVAYEPVPGVFAGVRPACPRCPWRGHRTVVAGSYKWRAWIFADVSNHHCAAPDQEKPE